VITPPLNVPQINDGGGDELVRHFLVEPTSKGVKLKGYSNEPVFASLSALVYQHTVTPLALPSRLLLPEADIAASHSPSRDSTDSRTSMQQLLTLGAACNVMYLFTIETDSLTGPNAVKKGVSQLMLTRPKPHATLVHFKVSSQGITLTDHGRKLFFRKHYNTAAISFCGIDPEDRRWAMKAGKKAEQDETSQRIFGFVAKKHTSRGQNQCHVFAEQDPDQPARAVVNFVNKVLLNSGSSSSRADVV
jgi:tensin